MSQRFSWSSDWQAYFLVDPLLHVRHTELKFILTEKETERVNMGSMQSDGDESNDSDSLGMAECQNPSTSSSSGDLCLTRKIIQSNCSTEEVDPGKFVRKCENTEQILWDCVGRPTEIVQSNKVYTEEDVTHEVMRGPSLRGSTDIQLSEFEGLHDDIVAIERSFLRVIDHFVEVTDEMRNILFRLLDNSSLSRRHSSSSAAATQETPIEDTFTRKTGQEESDSGVIDLDGLARDV